MRLALPVAFVMGMLALLAAVPALADFGDPGTDPAESPRVNTPNDPDFDKCEADDEDPPDESCGSYFSEQFGAFGFSPDSANDPTKPFNRTTYDRGPTGLGDCPQLDEQGKRANRAAETVVPDAVAECFQIAGVRADSAWKYSTGSPDTSVAILDTGIEWDARELVEKVHLNTDELLEPQVDGPRLIDDADCDEYSAGGGSGGPYDANDDGAVNVRDYACDPRLDIELGDNGANGETGADALLDPSDLIARFSNDDDDDPGGGNGYVDDIAGWDFFDDDNDPFDASSCCSATGHGTDRAMEAGRQTDDARGETAICPECQIMPLRVWDSFVVDSNLYALGVVYATDNGASVVEGAVGGLLNSNFARRAFTYADRKGVALTLVSSDINSANHNYPTNYNEAIYVGGSLPDSAPSDCNVPSAPGVGGIFELPDFAAGGCGEFFRFLSDRTGGTTPPSTQPPTTSFFRNSNLTQYGGKADIVLVGATGSANTGQASGAAGLLASYGRKVFGDGDALSGNEIRQLLTMTAEDVMPENTGSIGLPDRANDGWDTHFGYGRVNLAGAMDRIEERRIPPEAQIDSPDWFAPINVDRVGADGVPIKGRAAAPHGQVGDWEIEYACGQDAEDADFQPLLGASGNGAASGELGRLPRQLLQNMADDCDGSVSGDAGRPAGRQSDAWPADPYPDPDPERHAFQIRLTVHAQGDRDNFGRYRKTLFPYNDDGNLQGWPKPIGSGSSAEDLVTGSGGETPPRLADIDGDNRLDVVQGTSSGELYVLDRNGDPLESFNDGDPVITNRYAAAQSHDRPADSLEGDPRESLRAPAIGDITGDGEPEVVSTAGEYVYAWERDGDVVEGFPARIDPDLSEPCREGAEKPCFDAADRLRNRQNHIKRGFFGSPALADLDQNGRLDVVAGSLDQHVYAFDGDGDPLASFNEGEPLKLEDDRATSGAEIVTSPAIADLDGNGDPEVVIATNEVIEGEFSRPDIPQDIVDAFVRGALGANVVYAIEGNGDMVGGEWPVELGTLQGDILPLVVPSNDAAVLDVDNDGDDEVALAAATADAKLVDGDGSTMQTFNNDAAASSNVFDRSMQLNLADYPSVGELSDGQGPSVIKGGISLNGVVNLLAVNQNLPFNHVVQAWDPTNGQYRPQYPVATDDFQLVSQPAIGKVNGSGTDRQTLVGTGLYQLHAYGPLGDEPASWPKFLGGWVQPTPSVGDVDGDNKLEVTAVTREGWSFVWNTDADACQSGSTTTNQEWWTFHHDEFSTANYGTDARPPSRPGTIDVRRGPSGILLSFIASGDDLKCGTPERYEARGSNDPIESGADFRAAEPLDTQGGALQRGGQPQQLFVEDGGSFRFVAIRAVDDAGNVSYVRSAAVPPDDGGGGDGGGDGSPRSCQGEQATIKGSGSDDELRGTSGRDVIVGRGGDDEIRGRGGRDLICAGGGDDEVNAGSGADYVSGVAGEDRLGGGSGRDRIKGGSGDDRLDGGSGRDSLTGARGDDRLDGDGGHDLLRGRDGRDDLRGGDGRDDLRGGSGRDRLRGGDGRDRVHGGSGRDDVRD